MQCPNIINVKNGRIVYMKYWSTRGWLLLLSEARYVTWHLAIICPEITLYMYRSPGKQKKKGVFFWDRLISHRIIVYGYCRNVSEQDWVLYHSIQQIRKTSLLQPLSRLTRETSLARTSYVKYYLSSADVICRSRNVMNRRKALRSSILSVRCSWNSRNTWKLKLHNEDDIGMCSACNGRWIRVIGKSVINSVLISAKEMSVYPFKRVDGGMFLRRKWSFIFHLKRLSLSTTVSSNNLFHGHHVNETDFLYDYIYYAFNALLRGSIKILRKFTAV